MEFFAFVGILLLLGFIVGSIISYVNLSSISELKRQIISLRRLLSQQSTFIQQLQKDITVLSQRSEQAQNSETKAAANNDNDASHANEQAQQSDLNSDTTITSQAPSTQSNPLEPTKNSAEPAPQPEVARMSASPSKNLQVKKVDNTNIKKESVSFSLDKFLSGNGLLWIGAVILSLGGVFLAKYSIEAGLLPPHVRIIAGAIFGIALIVAAEYLYRHPKKFQIQSEVICGALASAGVITCFAMTLVAFDFYAYLSPLMAFAVLAIISVGATCLSIRFGPILAAIGVIGSYLVPALVSTGSNNVFALLSYVAFVSASAVWVYHMVQREWLWWMSFLGHFIWLLLAILIGGHSDISVILVFVFVSLYLFVIAPVLGWKCLAYNTDKMTTKMLLMPRKEQLGLLVSVVSIVTFYVMHGFDNSIYAAVSLLAVLFLLVPIRHSAFHTWPFLSLLLCWFVLIIAPQDYDFTDNLFAFAGVLLFTQVFALVFVVYAYFMLKHFADRHSYLMLLVLAPLSLYALSYALFPNEASEFLYPVWSIQLAIYATVFVVFSIKIHNNMHKASYLLLSNGAISLILTMLLSAGTLTIALSLQIALISFVARKYALTLPSWILKIAIAVLLLRFTAAPWLDEYSTQVILGLHWSIVVYPIAFACFYVAKMCHARGLHAWLDGAMLHIAALFVTTETSYFLQGRYLTLDELTWRESVLIGMNWLILAGIYLWRRQHTSLQTLYKWFALALCGGAAFMHSHASVVDNPFLTNQDIGQNILFNWLLPLWAIPSLVLLSFLYFRLIQASLRRYLWIVSGVFAALYVNATIRLLYNEGISLVDYNIGQDELYTYSIVWLAIAACLIVLAQKLAHQRLNKIGFAVLALVVLKAFLIDLANLDGLFRALSFIGLGLSLVAIGWLFQRFKQASSDEEELNNTSST